MCICKRIDAHVYTSGRRMIASWIARLLCSAPPHPPTSPPRCHLDLPFPAHTPRCLLSPFSHPCFLAAVTRVLLLPCSQAPPTQASR